MSVTNRKIKIQFDRMDLRKRELMDLIRPLPDEMYRRQPDPSKWSIAQIANHLFLSEQLSLAYLKKKLSYPDTIPPFSIRSWWALFQTVFILRTNIKVKAPPKINMWGEQEIYSPDELDQRWNMLRQEMSSLINENYSRFRRHLVYNHPFAGRMTMTQMLRFMNHHIAHHLRQIHGLLKKIR